MAKTRTQANIGIRRYHALLGGFRNFEISGTQYVVNRSTGYDYRGIHYAMSSTIPYDSGNSYLDLATLERDWNSGILNSAS